MSIADFIFTSLKEKLPTISWEAGSTIKELIANPIAAVTDIANTAISRQLNAYTVDLMVKDPEGHRDAINEAFNTLGLINKDLVQATGIITITTTSPDPITIAKGTVFYYGEGSLASVETIEASVSPSNGTWAPMRQLLGDYYAFDVPVQCPTFNKTITTGVSLVWAEAPRTVYDIKVTSAVSGGRSTMTLAEKAQMIKDHIAPSVLTMDAGITKALRLGLPDAVVDAVFDKNINNSKYSYVYVKTTKAPGIYELNVKGKVEEGQLKFTVESAGIIYIDYVYSGTEPLSIISSSKTTEGVLCCAQAPSNYKDGDFVDIKVMVYGLSQLDEVQRYLDNYLLGSPYSIKVASPDTYIMDLEFDYIGTELRMEEANSIAEALQFKALNTIATDKEVAQLLQQSGKYLKDVVTYTLTRYDGVCYKQTQQSPTIYSSGKPVATYVGINNIKGIHVY